jgi:hypothetical protein
VISRVGTAEFNSRAVQEQKAGETLSDPKQRMTQSMMQKMT